MGGGIAGLSLLYRLHRSGFDNLLLIDKDSMVSGESGKSAGIVLHNDEGLRSLEIYRELEVGIKEYPEFSYVNPYEYAIKIYYGLRSEGVVFELFEEVTGFETFEGQVLKVITSRDTYDVERLFLAANIGNLELLDKLEIDVPFKFLKIQEAIFHSEKPLDMVGTHVDGFYIRTEGTNSLIVLGEPQEVEEHRHGLTRADEEFVERVVELLLSLGYEELGLRRTLIGYEMVVPRNYRTGTNVYVFSCLNGWGSTNAPYRAWNLEI